MSIFEDHSDGYRDFPCITDPLQLPMTTVTECRSLHDVSTAIGCMMSILREAGSIAMISDMDLLTDDTLERINGDLREVMKICNSIVHGTRGLRRCRQCGSIFVGNSLTHYCSPECRRNGPVDNYRRKLDSDSALRAYNRAYKTRHARVMKGTMSDADFQSWKKTAKDKLTAVRSGDLSNEEFNGWLGSDLLGRNRRRVK